MTEPDDFDLDRSTAEAWDAFTERLSEVLSVMDETSDLTIGSIATDAATVPFVRFTCRDGVVRAEAASNAVLGEHYQLSADRLDQMGAAGWNDPSAVGEGASENFWTQASQEETDGLAAKAVAVLRDVYGIQHPAFLAPDQLAEILTPKPVDLDGYSEFDPEDIVATVPVNVDHLVDMMAVELTEVFGHEPLRDAEGDFAIRVGSTMVFIRVSPDHREIIVFACLVQDIDGRSRAMEVLSDLNTEVRGVKFLLIRDRVFASVSLLAHPFVPAHLHQASRLLAEVADGMDDELAKRLHGRTVFGDDTAS